MRTVNQFRIEHTVVCDDVDRLLPGLLAKPTQIKWTDHFKFYDGRDGKWLGLPKQPWAAGAGTGQ